MSIKTCLIEVTNKLHHKSKKIVKHALCKNVEKKGFLLHCNWVCIKSSKYCQLVLHLSTGSQMLLQ